MKYFLPILILIGMSAATAADFSNYTTDNSGLTSNTVNAIVIDGQGNKWFGTDQGLCVFDGANWSTFTKTDEKQTLADDRINDIAYEVTSYGAELWVATKNGITVVNIDDIDAMSWATPYRSDSLDIISDTITSVTVDTARHERWFGTPLGLTMFNGGVWFNYTTETEPSLAHDNVAAIGVDYTEGWKYVCTTGHDDYAISRLRTTVDGVTSASPYDYSWSGILSPDVYAVYVDAEGSQWYGTGEGVAYHDTTETKAKWETFTTVEGLVNNTVLSITADLNGTIIAGTEGGLSAISYEWIEKVDQWGFQYDSLAYSITNYTSDDGLVANKVVDIAVDKDGSLWLATENGVSHFTGVAAVQTNRPTAPKSFGLVKNYPNPFNPSTTISYQLETRRHVQLDIVNMRGELVKRLVNTNQSSGRHDVHWNGLNYNGSPAASGIYMAVLRSDDGTQQVTDSMKMLLVK